MNGAPGHGTSCKKFHAPIPHPQKLSFPVAPVGRRTRVSTTDDAGTMQAPVSESMASPAEYRDNDGSFLKGRPKGTSSRASY
jgi:hypothetical protein